MDEAISSQEQLTSAFVRLFDRLIRKITQPEIEAAFLAALERAGFRGPRVILDSYEAERLQGLRPIYAVGKTPEEAIAALCAAEGWGEPQKITPLEGGGEDGYDWGYRFTADGEASFKCAGQNIPGGVVLSWWS